MEGLAVALIVIGGPSAHGLGAGQERDSLVGTEPLSTIRTPTGPCHRVIAPEPPALGPAPSQGLRRRRAAASVRTASNRP
jgi:hypothetical protein